MNEVITITGTESPIEVLEMLDIPEGAQIEVNGWEADDLSCTINPGTYEATDSCRDRDIGKPDYEIWFCTDDYETDWVYLYSV